MRGRECGPVEFADRIDGALSSDMLSAEGNRFAAYLFDGESFDFYELFERTLANKLPSPYHVEDRWENYDALAAELDAVYAKWR